MEPVDYMLVCVFGGLKRERNKRGRKREMFVNEKKPLDFELCFAMISFYCF